MRPTHAKWNHSLTHPSASHATIAPKLGPLHQQYVSSGSTSPSSSSSSSSPTRGAPLPAAALCPALFLWWLRFSPARDDLDRAADASWNVASAGVDGLLARPLLVVTVAGVCAAGVDAGAAGVEVAMGVGAARADSAFFSGSSGFGVSFFLFATGGPALLSSLASFAAGVATTPCVSDSARCAAGFGSGHCRAPLLGAVMSGVFGAVPLGLPDADGGLPLPLPLLLALLAPLALAAASGG